MLVIMGHASALAIVPNMLISPRTHAESWWSSIHPIRCDRFGARYRSNNSHFGIGVNWNGLWKGRGSCRSLMSANRLASFFAR